MSTLSDDRSTGGAAVTAECRRPLAVSSVFGDPLDRRTWSAAPANVAARLHERGFEIVPVHAGLHRVQQAVAAARFLLAGYGRPTSGESLSRTGWARAARARSLAGALSRSGPMPVLHTGTLDLPALSTAGAGHYLYCDHTWHLSQRFRGDLAAYSERARARFDDLERAALLTVRHVFTFGRYARDDIVSHYGLAPDRVTAVGSGWGEIRPYDGPKDHAGGHLLFVAKHYFREKGGDLLLKAFALARLRRPELRLLIVGQDRPCRAAEGVAWLGHVDWATLEALYRGAALLVQPMLNDPWGQVYLEALASRTPVLGLRRNGLPEILGDGRYGWLLDEASPGALAAGMLAALRDPERLAEMGGGGRRHVAASYSWDNVAARIAEVITADARSPGGPAEIA